MAKHVMTSGHPTMWGVRYPNPGQDDTDEMGSVTDLVRSREAAERLAEDIIAPNYCPELAILPPSGRRAGTDRSHEEPTR